MIVEIIIESLKQHQRIIVPQLGAFIVKGDGEQVVFSALLKKDDGLLRSIVTTRCANELEAAGKIDRFVFEVRHTLFEQGGRYPLGELGDMCLGVNGNIILSPLTTHEPDLFTEVAPEPVLEELIPHDETPEQIIPNIPTMEGESHYANRAPKPKRGGFDTFMLVALAAILLAIAAMVYGYVVENGGSANLLNSTIESMGVEIEIDGTQNITPDDLDYDDQVEQVDVQNEISE